MGDVLEHLTREIGTVVIPRLCGLCDELFVVVPYRMEQGPLDGVEWETHLQTDLDREVMGARYPGLIMLTEIVRPPTIGVYVKRN